MNEEHGVPAQSNTETPPIISAQPQTPFAPITEPSKPSGKKPLVAVVILSLLLVIAIGAGVYFFAAKSDTKSNESATQPAPVAEQEQLSPDEAFALMLEKNQDISTYHISATDESKSRSGQYANESNKAYGYEADVDVSDLKSMKLKATFDLDQAGKQAKGETVWIGEDVYIKLNDAVVTSYVDGTCYDRSYRTAKSPTIAALKANYVKTARSDQTLACGRGAYEDFIRPITYSNAPFGDLPLFKASALGELQQRAFTSTQGGQYKVYDGTLTELNGIKAYSYNVTIENYRISEMSKVLATAAGFIEDKNHVIGFGDGEMGQGSPGRYLKVWIHADTQQLLRVQSIVDTPNVDTVFTSTLDYSKYNQVLTITAPL